MSLKRQAISGVKWNFVQQFSVQIINFAVQIILARLLMPEMFGLIAMISVFISIGQSLMDSGMTSSLIRTDSPDQIDYSTVFITNIFVSLIIYSFIFMAAPSIANFYNQEVLVDLLRLFSLSFIINAFVAVHIAKLTKEMNFKSQMKIQIPSVILSALVGITLAYKGYGVWSLVWLNLARSIVFAVQAWLFIDWKPSIIFDKDRFLYHFKFGYKLTLSGLIDTIYNDSYRIIIGKFFSPASVGYFNHAETMRLFPVNQVSVVMNKVTYPYFSKIKDDIQLKEAYKTTMKMVLFVTTPLMLLLIIIAKVGFILVFGEKWLPSVYYFQILAFASIVRPIGSYNLNILKVKGKSDTFLRVEIYKKLIGILAIIIGIQYNILGLVVSLALVSYVWVFINMHYCGKLINFPLLEQVQNLIPIISMGIISTIPSLFLHNYVNQIYQNNLLSIFLTSFTYITIYLFMVYIIDKRFLILIKNTITNK